MGHLRVILDGKEIKNMDPWNHGSAAGVAAKVAAGAAARAAAEAAAGAAASAASRLLICT